MKPVLAVDWDGTCVESVYPAEGDWLPGASKALRKLIQSYTVYIFTCRTAPYAFRDWHTPVTNEQVLRETAYIRRMLDDAGLHEVEIWDREFKIPAVAYIDDKGIPFDGSWSRAVRTLRKKVGR